MTTTSKMARQFLVELNSKESQSLFQKLDFLLDHLETKEDPEPFEVQIVDISMGQPSLEEVFLNLTERNGEEVDP